jgi:hypothetical protein
VSEVTQQEAHLVVAAIRVLRHLHERAPRPEEVAEFLKVPPAILRMQLAALTEADIVQTVTSAFDNQVEVKDHLAIEKLEVASREGDLTDDLADFDRRKQEEAAKMERLFAEGEHRKKQADRLGKMDKELQDFSKKKPRNPFGDD